ncbi:MAG: heavy metal translocating P-type ATPase [Peptococcaceae bacterium]|nr:heavy metal translocating P-type ATPase [Peptococcaceae bacterium]
MKYQIIYDQPGRLRLRSGMYAFTEQQGYSLAALLRQNPAVLSVEVTWRNCGILIYYKEGCREEILQLVSSICQKDLIEIEAQEEDQSAKLDTDFQMNLVKTAGYHFARKLFLPVLLNNGWILYRSAQYIARGIKELWNHRLNVEVLDAASILASLAQRDCKTASSVMFLLNISSLLEEYTHKRTHNALARSLSINVDQVWRVDGDTDTLVPMADIHVNDWIRVRSGNLIPVDGRVIDGEAMINEASMTGESLAVAKRADSSVYAGTVLEEGSLVIQVTALSDESRIAQIMDMIDHSEALKAGVQSQAEHLADAIVPYSFLGAIGVFAITRNLTKALSVLMVDYSCAIKLSTPIAVISAMKEASDHGILIKGGKYFEIFSEADTIVFDKTGTITESCPKLDKVIPFGKYTRDEVLRISACLEEHFPHSVARAIVKQAEVEGLVHEELHAEVEYVVAHGISSKIGDKKCLIGSYHFIAEDEHIRVTQKQRMEIEAAAQGRSVIYLTIGKSLAGVLLIYDPPRPEAKAVIQDLYKEGIKRIYMLTGDSENAARAVAEEIGVTDYQAQVLPEDKANIIGSLRSDKTKLIMVGDGINDSPALAAADVSVAMQDASDLAREVADITLLHNNLEDIVFLRRLSNAMLQRIKGNYRFIVTFNTGLLVSGLAGLISPAVSAYLHNLSTMMIGASSMRLCLPGEPDQHVDNSGRGVKHEKT